MSSVQNAIPITYLSNNLADYPLKDVRNFAAGGGHSLLWPEATTFLSLRGAYSRPEAATVAKDL